jgi:hypothetical protein
VYPSILESAVIAFVWHWCRVCTSTRVDTDRISFRTITNTPVERLLNEMAFLSLMLSFYNLRIKQFLADPNIRAV